MEIYLGSHVSIVARFDRNEDAHGGVPIAMTGTTILAVIDISIKEINRTLGCALVNASSVTFLF